MSPATRRFPPDIRYMEWHREASIARYLGIERAHLLTMIDLDAIEYCKRCAEPLVLIETAQDRGQVAKATRVTTTLAKRAALPAALVYWLPNGADMVAFRVRSIWPQGSEQAMTPAEYAIYLWSFHERHRCADIEAAA